MKVLAPIIGQLKKTSKLKDDVFSTDMLGPGVAIYPENGELRSPISGRLVTVFETGHAFGIEAKDGTKILIHVGIDTVELEGKGFDVKVKQGKKIKAGALLANLDLEFLKTTNKELDVIVILLNESSKKISHILDSGKTDFDTVIYESE